MITKRDAQLIADALYERVKADVEKIVVATVKSTINAGDLVDIDEAALILGCSRKTIYNKITEIPHTKSGRCLRFSKSKLMEYMRINA